MASKAPVIVDPDWVDPQVFVHFEGFGFVKNPDAARLKSYRIVYDGLSYEHIGEVQNGDVWSYRAMF